MAKRKSTKPGRDAASKGARALVIGMLEDMIERLRADDGASLRMHRRNFTRDLHDAHGGYAGVDFIGWRTRIQARIRGATEPSDLVIEERSGRQRDVKGRA